MRLLKHGMDVITGALVALWVILAGLAGWRISLAVDADRWGYVIANLGIGWLGGLVTATLVQIFLMRNRDTW